MQVLIMQLIQPWQPKVLLVCMESIRAHAAMQKATNQPERHRERRPGCHHHWRSSTEDYPATSLRGGCGGRRQGVIISPPVSPLITMRPSRLPLQSGRPCTFVCLGLRACASLSNSIGPRQEIRAAVLTCSRVRVKEMQNKGAPTGKDGKRWVMGEPRAEEWWWKVRLRKALRCFPNSKVAPALEFRKESERPWANI